MANWKEPRIDYKPTDQVVPSIFNVLGENERYLQEVKITTEQVQNALVSSIESSIRENLTGNESIKAAFGKIRKYFADLKSLAFASIVQTSDISNGAVTNEKIQSVDASKVTGLAKVATSGDDNDLKNTPSVPKGVTIVDSLTSYSATEALSANQGRILNEKISNLGFKTGSISGVSDATLIRQGKLVIGKCSVGNNRSPLFTLPEGFRPKQAVSGVFGTQTFDSSHRVYVDVKTTVTFNTDGSVTSSATSSLSGSLSIIFGFEAS